MTQITIPTLNGSRLVEPLSIKGNLAIIQVNEVYAIVLTTSGLSPVPFIPRLKMAERTRDRLLALAPDWADLPLARSNAGRELRAGIREIVEGVA